MIQQEIIHMSKTLNLTILVFLLLSLCSCACTNDNDDTPVTPVPPGPVNPKPQDEQLPRAISIATWNVHNFFDPICDAGACGYPNYEPSVSNATYRTKLTNVSSGIWKLNADVVLLQEIEKESCLADVKAALEPNYKDMVFGEIGTTSSVDVGILTKGTITYTEKFRDHYWLKQDNGSLKRLARELLLAEITLPNGLEVTAVTTHFVSKATNPEGDRRQKEAVLTQTILAKYIEEHPDRLLIFGGDLNDTPESEPIQAIGKDGILISATKGMNPGAITTWHNESALDHIFYPAAFESKLRGTRIICDEDRYNGYSSSDHCSVMTEFLFYNNEQ